MCSSLRGRPSRVGGSECNYKGFFFPLRFGQHIWKEFFFTSFACTGHTTLALGQKFNKDSSSVLPGKTQSVHQTNQVHFFGLSSKYNDCNVELAVCLNIIFVV